VIKFKEKPKDGKERFKCPKQVAKNQRRAEKGKGPYENTWRAAAMLGMYVCSGGNLSGCNLCGGDAWVNYIQLSNKTLTLYDFPEDKRQVKMSWKDTGTWTKGRKAAVYAAAAAGAVATACTAAVTIVVCGIVIHATKTACDDYDHDLSGGTLISPPPPADTSDNIQPQCREMEWAHPEGHLLKVGDRVQIKGQPQSRGTITMRISDVEVWVDMDFPYKKDHKTHTKYLELA